MTNVFFWSIDLDRWHTHISKLRTLKRLVQYVKLQIYGMYIRICYYTRDIKLIKHISFINVQYPVYWLVNVLPEIVSKIIHFVHKGKSKRQWDVKISAKTVSYYYIISLASFGLRIKWPTLLILKLCWEVKWINIWCFWMRGQWQIWQW